jgi:uncharacterized protein YndB with AHSA1/START domain
MCAAQRTHQISNRGGFYLVRLRPPRNGRDTAVTESTATRELVITRTFNAPGARLFRAFTDPDQLAQWFGPVGFSVSRASVESDPRAGGKQRFVIVSDNDPRLKWAVSATFTDILENELLVVSQEWEERPGRESAGLYLRLHFDDQAGQTRLDLRQDRDSEGLAGMAREGWSSSFTKLDAFLAD